MIICKRPAPLWLYDHLQEARTSGWSFATTKKAWKMHFWDPSQWDKMCFEYQRNGSKFSHLLTARAEVADPPEPKTSVVYRLSLSIYCSVLERYKHLLLLYTSHPTVCLIGIQCAALMLIDIWWCLLILPPFLKIPICRHSPVVQRK